MNLRYSEFYVCREVNMDSEKRASSYENLKGVLRKMRLA
jgi:hypothetical protein